jgi:hypothetical protein
MIDHESVISKPNSEILSPLLADREGLILKLKEGNGKLQANLGVVNDKVIKLKEQLVANVEILKATNLSWQEKLNLSEICNAELKSVIDANHAVIDANHANMNRLQAQLNEEIMHLKEKLSKADQLYLSTESLMIELNDCHSQLKLSREECDLANSEIYNLKLLLSEEVHKSENLHRIENILEEKEEMIQSLSSQLQEASSNSLNAIDLQTSLEKAKLYISNLEQIILKNKEEFESSLEEELQSKLKILLELEDIKVRIPKMEDAEHDLKNRIEECHIQIEALKNEGVEKDKVSEYREKQVLEESRIQVINQLEVEVHELRHFKKEANLTAAGLELMIFELYNAFGGPTSETIWVKRLEFINQSTLKMKNENEILNAKLLEAKSNLENVLSSYKTGNATAEEQETANDLTNAFMNLSLAWDPQSLGDRSNAPADEETANSHKLSSYKAGNATAEEQETANAFMNLSLAWDPQSLGDRSNAPADEETANTLMSFGGDSPLLFDSSHAPVDEETANALISIASVGELQLHSDSSHAPADEVTANFLMSLASVGEPQLLSVQSLLNSDYITFESSFVPQDFRQAGLMDQNLYLEPKLVHLNTILIQHLSGRILNPEEYKIVFGHYYSLIHGSKEVLNTSFVETGVNVEVFESENRPIAKPVGKIKKLASNLKAKKPSQGCGDGPRNVAKAAD